MTTLTLKPRTDIKIIKDAKLADPKSRFSLKIFLASSYGKALKVNRFGKAFIY